MGGVAVAVNWPSIVLKSMEKKPRQIEIKLETSKRYKQKKKNEHTNREENELDGNTFSTKC